MTAGLRQRIEQRAGERCEYCQAPAFICAYTFHLEHCIPKAAGGKSGESNLALACASCNFKKSSHTHAMDPVSGAMQPVFHPVAQLWNNHFSLKGSKITGKTAVGRASVVLLDLNSLKRQEARKVWRSTGLWP